MTQKQGQNEPRFLPKGGKSSINIFLSKLKAMGLKEILRIAKYKLLRVISDLYILFGSK